MSILNLIKQLLVELIVLVKRCSYRTDDNLELTGEIKIMYIVKDDNPDVGFKLAFTVTDAEGNVVPDDSLEVMVESDNEEAVVVTTDETGRAGTVSFGSPGLANVNVTVENADGGLLGSFGAQFTVTVGDPKAIVGGTLTFEGITESTPVV